MSTITGLYNLLRRIAGKIEVKEIAFTAFLDIERAFDNNSYNKIEIAAHWVITSTLGEQSVMIKATRGNPQGKKAQGASSIQHKVQYNSRQNCNHTSHQKENYSCSPKAEWNNDKSFQISQTSRGSPRTEIDMETTTRDSTKEGLP
ncbi:hypothetical protein J6590_038062 [Homalodisca vitripennis]|nr:hypothetical protein J6590_038062 [Homalodisca vitripennis]